MSDVNVVSILSNKSGKSRSLLSMKANSSILFDWNNSRYMMNVFTMELIRSYRNILEYDKTMPDIPQIDMTFFEKWAKTVTALDILLDEELY